MSDDLDDEYRRDELAVAMGLDGDAVEELLKRTFDIAYTYVCETGSTEGNALKKHGAYEMRWAGHLDQRLIATQILRLLVDRRIDRAASLLREVTGESDEPSWEGVPGGAEHRTVGPHRAWCLSCSEWCYPDEDGMCPCCQETLGREALWIDPKVGPPERAILQDLITELRELDVALSERGQAIPALRISRIKAEARLKEVQGDD